MTRTLILVRHAEPDRDRMRYHDHEYPLTQHGQVEAHHLGKQLVQRWPNIDRVYSSSAVRAKQTTEILCQYVTPAEFEVRDDLYMPMANTVIDIIQGCVDEESVMIVAHEPTMSLLVERLAVQRPDMYAGFPTAGAAVLTVGGDWANMTHGLADYELLTGGDKFLL